MNQHFAESKTIKITKLDNGLTIATEAMSHIHTATLGVWVATGSRHEKPNEHGLSHLIEHMAFKGTARRTARQIAEDVENVGGEINAATSIEFTSYTARVLGETIDTALDVIGDILTNSTFEAGELAKEKNVILQEYAAVQDSPDEIVYDAFMETAFSGQAIGRPILGTPQTLEPLDGAAIRSFMDREYAPEKMVLAASGSVDHDHVVEMGQKLFGAMPKRVATPVEPGLYRGGERRIERKLEQANVVLGLPGLSFKDPGHQATHLFAHVLGGGLTSRLWHEVRETRGLAYSIEAFHWPFSDCGLFGIGAGTGGADLADLFEVALETALKATRDIEEIEISRAKAQLKVGLLAALETPGGRIERIARQLLAWGRIIPSQELVDKIEKLTVEDVRHAGKVALAGAPTLAAIGPLKKLPKVDEIAKRLG